MGAAFDGSSSSVRPEPYDFEGPRRAVAQAEAELITRHGSFENLVLATGNRQSVAVQLSRATGWTRLYLDAEGKSLAAGWIPFAKTIG